MKPRGFGPNCHVVTPILVNFWVWIWTQFLKSTSVTTLLQHSYNTKFIRVFQWFHFGCLLAIYFGVSGHVWRIRRDPSGGSVKQVKVVIKLIPMYSGYHIWNKEWNSNNIRQSQAHEWLWIKSYPQKGENQKIVNYALIISDINFIVIAVNRGCSCASFCLFTFSFGYVFEPCHCLPSDAYYVMSFVRLGPR